MRPKRIAIAAAFLVAGALAAIGLASGGDAPQAPPATTALQGIDEVRTPGGLASLPKELQLPEGRGVKAGVSVEVAGETVTAWSYTARSGMPMMATLEENAGFTIGGCDKTSSVVRPCSGTNGPGVLRWFGTAAGSVASIEARFSDGPPVAAALRDGIWVLDVGDRGVPAAIVARDSNGATVAGHETAKLRDTMESGAQGAADLLSRHR